LPPRDAKEAPKAADDMTTEQQVAAHYGNVGIAERVPAQFHAAHGADAPVTVDRLAPLDQFHDRGDHDQRNGTAAFGAKLPDASRARTGAAAPRADLNRAVTRERHARLLQETGDGSIVFSRSCRRFREFYPLWNWDGPRQLCWHAHALC
jgi:hypothetical protein